MATIEVKRYHPLSREIARTRAEQLAQKIERRLGVCWVWRGETIELHAPSGAAKGTSAKVSLEPGLLHIVIDLPIVLRPMKSLLEGKLNEKLDELLVA